jgi:hypothetical protein
MQHFVEQIAIFGTTQYFTQKMVLRLAVYNLQNCIVLYRVKSFNKKMQKTTFVIWHYHTDGCQIWCCNRRVLSFGFGYHRLLSSSIAITDCYHLVLPSREVINLVLPSLIVFIWHGYHRWLSSGIQCGKFQV